MRLYALDKSSPTSEEGPSTGSSGRSTTQTPSAKIPSQAQSLSKIEGSFGTNQKVPIEGAGLQYEESKASEDVPDKIGGLASERSKDNNGVSGESVASSSGYGSPSLGVSRSKHFKKDSSSSRARMSSSSEESSDEVFGDTDPWNMEGTQTIIENVSYRKLSGEGGSASYQNPTDFSWSKERVEQLGEQNRILNESLVKATSMIERWQRYHEERETYIQRLTKTIQDLQHLLQLKASSKDSVLKGETPGGSSSKDKAGEEDCVDPEVKQLRSRLAQQAAEHKEHVALLEMQVKAHRDDWEAERSEKQAAQFGLRSAEAKLALLVQENQLFQAKMAEMESRRELCQHCLLPRTDFSSGRPSCRTPAKSRLNGTLLLPPASPRSGSSSPPSPASSSHASPTSKSPKLSPSSRAHSEVPSCPRQPVEGSAAESETAATKDTVPVSLNAQVLSDNIMPDKMAVKMPSRVTGNEASRLLKQDSLATSGSTSQAKKSSDYKRLSKTSSPLPEGFLAIPTINEFKVQDGDILHSEVVVPAKQSPISVQLPSQISNESPVNPDEDKDAKHRARSILASALPLPSGNMASSLPSCSGVSHNNIPVPVAYKGCMSNAINLLPSTPTCQVDRSSSPYKVPIVTKATVRSHSNSSSGSTTRSSSTSCEETLKNYQISPALGKVKTTYEVPPGNLSPREVTALSPSSSTTFASITVTTTTANITPVGGITSTSASCYSPTASSRSSSPGVSLTTFALNSEGRGVPGTIFFALGSEPRGLKSPTSCSSPKLANSSGSSNSTSASLSPKDHQSSPPSMRATMNIKQKGKSKGDLWWVMEGNERGSGLKLRANENTRQVNSAWVRLMDSEEQKQNASYLPWKTAKVKQDERSNANSKDSEPNSPAITSATAVFTYTPAVNCSPSSSCITSACNSTGNSPLPLPDAKSINHLKSMASKNISSAIINYELGVNSEVPEKPTSTPCKPLPTSSHTSPPGVDTITKTDLVCPSCKKLFVPERHIDFLDHFEKCGGPKYADM